MLTNFEWFRRGTQVIAQGCLTNSKHPDCHVFGFYPTHVKGGRGALLYGASDETYVDYICGLGTNLFGYGNEEHTKAVYRWLDRGFSHSFSTTQEVETAEMLCNQIPYLESVKFLNSGSEACSAALIIARAFTGRTTVYSSDYHGHSAEFTSLTPPANGCPYSPHIKKLTDDADLSHAAAVIIEPVITDMSRERLEWLKALREKTTKSGCLLIFDEVILGFRVPRFSLAQHWGLKPDLTIFGKAMSGGLSCTAVAGRHDVMNCAYFVSTTTGGDTAGLAASMATLEALSRKKYDIDELWDRGERFKNQFNDLARGVVEIQGYNTRGVIAGTDMNKALFFQEMARAGVLFGPSWFYNFPLMHYDKSTLGVVDAVCGKIRLGAVKLEGKMPKKPYAAKVRDNDKP